jgi:epoxyqueuosine reductase
MTAADLAAQIRQWAAEAGFVRCGFACATSVPPALRRVWLARGKTDGLEYLSRHADLRSAPKKLQPSAKTIISLAMSYAPAPSEARESDDWISLYARGRDYHRVLKQRAHRLCNRIAESVDDFEARTCVDTAPVAERYWAVQSGVGWLGRNGMVIVPGAGSHVLLAEILCNLSLPEDAPLTDEAGDCASCGRCVAACPTGALDDAECFQAGRCLSYHTIENRGHIPPDIQAAMTNQLYGCDVCQRVCPFNRDVPPGEMELRNGSTMPTAEAVAAWSESQWDEFTCGKALRRAKFDQWVRNAKILLANRVAKR